MSKQVMFEFSENLRARLTANGEDWDQLLFDACHEARAKEVKATLFCETLRKSGFRCGTGPARAAYKAVREGKDLKGMIAAITAVKKKRKSVKPAEGSLEWALMAAMKAAKTGKLEVTETWLVKAQAILDTIKAAAATKAAKAAAPKAPKAAAAPKATKATKAPKAPKATKAPKAPKATKAA